MLSGFFTAGFVAGVGVTLLALKILPVKISFSWGEATWLEKVKKKAVKFHPQYCDKCGTAPCQDTYDHRFGND